MIVKMLYQYLFLQADGFILPARCSSLHVSDERSCDLSHWKEGKNMYTKDVVTNFLFFNVLKMLIISLSTL